MTLIELTDTIGYITMVGRITAKSTNLGEGEGR